MIFYCLVIAVMTCLLSTGITWLISRKYHISGKSRSGSVVEDTSRTTLERNQQLQISKKELELVFDAIPEQVCIIDSDFNIIRANKSLANFIMYPIRQVLGKKCYRLVWSREDRCRECPVAQSFKKGIPIIRKPFSRTINETERHFEVSSFPVFDEKGETVHVIEFTKDITDEKHMIEQLIRSEKLVSIGNMTAGIAHEMNNPLSGISGNAANLLKWPEKYGLNEKGIDRITTILNSAARATAIMTDLLHLSNRPEQADVLININALFIKTVNAVHIDGSQEIERKFNIDKTIPSLSCDPSKIQQVFIHIVTNAIQAILEEKKQNMNSSPFKGLMVFSTKKRRNSVQITIADNGIGISEENRIKIFDPFYSTRPTGQGTGLGLSVSNKIIEEHGGKLFFEYINNMTHFSIVIPLKNSI